MVDKLIQFVPLLAHYPLWLQRWAFYILPLLVLATILLLLYYLPSALKAKKQIIRIEFEKRPPFVDPELFRIGNTREKWNVYLYRVRIVNDSDESTAKVKYLKLTDLAILEGQDFKPWPNAVPVILEWDNTKPRTISPKENVLAQFARVFPPGLQNKLDGHLTGSADIPHFRFTVPRDKWPMKMTSNVPPGTHRFNLTAYFENTPPAEAKIEIEWSKQQDNVEAMVQEIKIKMLNKQEVTSSKP